MLCTLCTVLKCLCPFISTGCYPTNSIIFAYCFFFPLTQKLLFLTKTYFLIFFLFFKMNPSFPLMDFGENHKHHGLFYSLFHALIESLSDFICKIQKAVLSFWQKKKKKRFLSLKNIKGPLNIVLKVSPPGILNQIPESSTPAFFCVT